MNIQHAFWTNEEVMTDGSGSVWELLSPDGERIASASTKDAIRELEIALNMELTDWLEEDESDRVVNVS